MPLQQFKEVRFKPKSLDLIDTINGIIDTYLAAGYVLTLRQLYYQLVSRNLIRNNEKTYKNLGNLLSDARYAGLVDWDAIEDRNRVPRKSPQWQSAQNFVDSVVPQLRYDRWEDQNAYAELWVEKDALAGVLLPLAREYHVTLMVNRGYSSSSAMYESANRFKDADADGRECVLFYLGDHDPSGLDMVRDIGARFETFGAFVDVQHIALTMAQVKQYDPPPNPAKVTDSRAEGYIAEHGRTSWEVDALPPDVLNALIRESFDGIIDKDAMDAVKAQETRDKERLKDALTAVEALEALRNLGNPNSGGA